MTSNSIRIGRFVDINGVAQWITIRGDDRRQPAVVMVSGPGVPLSSLAPFFAPWEARLTLVQWDQPGAGSTHARHGGSEVEPCTLGRLKDDLVAVLETVRELLDGAPLFLLGISAGSVPGLMVALERPDLLTAYVGTGQIVHWRRQQALAYEGLVETARAEDDAEAVATLERIGPPPWPSLEDEATASGYMGAMTAAEQAAMAGLPPAVLAAMASPPPDADYLAPGVTLEDPRERAALMYGMLREEIAGFDAWRLNGRFEVPLYFLQGEHDRMTISSEVERYAGEVRAPHAEVLILRDAGHTAFYLRDAFAAELERVVRGVLDAGRES
jgi:pimeloyl-ACP methyl ester carboxylesterase